MGNSCTNVFPNTRAWEQQEWNKIKKQMKTIIMEAWVWKEVKRHEWKKSRRPITTYQKYNMNKHNIVLFYKIWKMYDEIQLTKNKMDLNNRKMTNHPPSSERRKILKKNERGKIGCIVWRHEPQHRPGALEGLSPSQI